VERGRVRSLSIASPAYELVVLLAVAGVLNLWALSRNAWANEYYSAAARSMTMSLHNFLFASFDPSGVMTVDKPPLALWIQVASVKLFGFHPLSILVPQALMGMASVALIYDLTRRRFGRPGGFGAGLVLALTPITVAISRHNNPDALLVLCCVGALWSALRGLENGRTRWLVIAGVCVGLGFETKMAVALMMVPGIVVAWLWVAPSGRLAALRKLLLGGAAMLVVGGAWPALVALTPSTSRPWVSGTSDNSILSLIFGYNGFGRLDGQAGGPGGVGSLGGSVFGGSTGPLRLLDGSLGGQAGWLLGFAVVSGAGILVASRLRRADPRSGWLLTVGGAFLTSAVAFSFAQGIFHPYYVSLVAPFEAALVGAGAAQLIGGGLQARILGPLAVAGGVATELAVLHVNPRQLTSLAPELIAVCALAACGLALFTRRRARMATLAVALAMLLVAPASWAVDTLGHATSGTFPAGGPLSAATGGPGAGFGGGGFGGGFGGAGSRTPGSGRAGAGRGGFARGRGAGGSVPLFGGSAGAGAAPGGGGFGGGGGGFGGFGGGFGGGPFGGGDDSLNEVLAYVNDHGGGTIAVASQQSAAAAVIASGARVAGIGGFSGQESEVSASWFAQELRSGRIRWVIASGAGGFGGGLRRGSRIGSTRIMALVAKACRPVSLTAAGGSSALSDVAAGEFFDCRGRASAVLAASG
jgi:4-amino-4-deoxy-L-arabinose transferase-like glycosyltransferase